MQSLRIMCGLPRCGKSTYIEENKRDSIVICPDEIRADIFGHQYHLNAEPFVWSVVHTMGRLLMKQGKSILVDETSMTERSRSFWKNLADQYHIPLDIVWVQTSIKECLKRNALSTEGVDKLPDGIIEGKAFTFEPPVANVLAEPPIAVYIVNPNPISYKEELARDFEGYEDFVEGNDNL